MCTIFKVKKLHDVSKFLCLIIINPIIFLLKLQSPSPKLTAPVSASLRSTTPFPLTQWAEATHCFPIKWTGNLRIKPAATKVKK